MAVRDDLDVAVGEQEVDEDAVVFLGIPDVQGGEHLDGPLARRLTGDKGPEVQRPLDRVADLSPVPGLRGSDGRLDARERRRRECPPHQEPWKQ